MSSTLKIAPVAFVLCATLAGAQSKPASSTPASTSAKVGFIATVYEGITLTQSQQDSVQKLKAMLDTEGDSLKRAYRASPDNEAIMGQLKAYSTKQHDLLRGVLTPEQQAAFDKNYDAMLARRSQRSK